MSLYYPPASRFTTYQPGVIQGVFGGIPTFAGGAVINVADYGWSDAASGSANTSAFAAALAASGEGDIISIPAGTFNIVNLDIPYNTRNRIVRGAGMLATVLRPSAGIGVQLGTGFNSSFAPTSAVTSMTKDSAVITVSDGSGFPSPAGESTHRIGRISLANDTSLPVASPYGFDNIRTVTVKMISRTGNSITLAQPLPSAFAGAPSAVFTLGFQLPTNVRKIGIENLQFDGSASTGLMQFGMAFNMCDECWIKGVKVIGHNNYAVYMADCTGCEMRGCWLGAGFGGAGSNRAGLLYNGCSYGLIEDSIFVDNGPDLEINFGSICNIFSFNYVAGQINCNHGPHNSYNLIEGCSHHLIIADGYFGGCSEETDFRNWARSNIQTQGKRWTRNRNMIGNVMGVPGGSYTTDGISFLGNPNIGNNGSISTAEPSTGDWWLDWDIPTGKTVSWPGVLTTRTTDTSGVITLDPGNTAAFAASLAAAADPLRMFRAAAGSAFFLITIDNVAGDVVTFSVASGVIPTAGTAIVVLPGTNGFQEKDLDVLNTSILKANHYVFSDFYTTTNSIPAAEGLGVDTLPDSYCYTSEPSWWPVGLTWPPINPYDVSSLDVQGTIPAALRFFGTPVPDPPIPPVPPTIHPLRSDAKRRGLLGRH